MPGCCTLPCMAILAARLPGLGAAPWGPSAAASAQEAAGCRAASEPSRPPSTCRRCGWKAAADDCRWPCWECDGGGAACCWQRVWTTAGAEGWSAAQCAGMAPEVAWKGKPAAAAGAAATASAAAAGASRDQRADLMPQSRTVFCVVHMNGRLSAGPGAPRATRAASPVTRMAHKRC